jgi:hypothetical protein
VLSPPKVESNVETTIESVGAWNAGDAGSQGVEKPMEAPEAFIGCACTNAKASAATSSRPNIMFAHLRTMHRSYTRMHEPAIEWRRELLHHRTGTETANAGRNQIGVS